MATKPGAEAAADETGKPKKSKKLLIIIVAVLVLVLAAGGGVLFMLKGLQNNGDDAEETVQQASAGKPRTPPAFVPLDNLVVNLADTGGNRYAQVGVTIQVADVKTSDTVKGFMPSIRNGILLLASQRTAEELLGAQGKERLAADILAFVQTETGLTPGQDGSPVQAVLFVSFIVQ